MRPEAAVLRLLLFCGSLLAALLILIVFSDIFQPLLIGLALAYLFDPAVSWLERRGSSRATASILLGLFLFVGVLGLVFYVLPTMSAQLGSAADNLPEYSRRLREQIEPWMRRYVEEHPEQSSQLRESLMQALKSNLSSLAGLLGKVVGTTFSSVLGFLLFLLNLIFVPVFTFYLLVDFPQIRKGLADLIPIPYRAVSLARLGEVDQAISSFLRGQLTIAVILATINSLGLMLLRVPLGLVLGISAGLANMVPYMALVVGLLPALLLCWAEHQSLARLAGVLAVFGGAQAFEGMVLSPRILGASINLHPVWVLLSILVGGNLFGFFGMLVAVPTAATIQVFARHWIRLYKSSKIYAGSSEATSSAPSQALAPAPLDLPSSPHPSRRRRRK